MAASMQATGTGRAAAGRAAPAPRAAVSARPFTASRLASRPTMDVRAAAEAAAAGPAGSGVEKKGPNFKAAKDIEAIMATLPTNREV